MIKLLIYFYKLYINKIFIFLFGAIKDKKLLYFKFYEYLI